jgi:hypothetical protein
MAGTVKWNGVGFRAEFVGGLNKNLNAAGALLVKEIKRVLNVRGQTKTETTSKSGKVRRRYGKVGSEPSRPGEPPRKQTGRLFRSVRKRLLGSKYNKATGKSTKSNKVRVSAAGQLLEFGRHKKGDLDPRPFMRPTFKRLQPAIRGIMTRPVKMRNTAKK